MNRAYGCTAALFVLVLASTTQLVAQTSQFPVPGRTTADTATTRRGERTAFRVEKVTTGIVLDGQLTEPGWQRAVPIVLSYETHPGDNTPARVETECLITYDDDHLYFGCAAADPDPRSIRAFVTDRDGIDGQDYVAMAIDPFNDARRAFMFAVSPLGVQQDMRFDEHSGWDTSWDAIWRAAGRIGADGYVVEAAVPFKSLRFPPGGDAQTWGFYALRAWPRTEAVELRSMRWHRNDSCVLCQANLLQGIKGVSPGRNLEFTPTLTAGRTDRRAEVADDDLERGPLDRELGLDIRWGVTPNLSLNATANPDFSQVEADVAQLDVNNRFAVFFPEKRPFFLEGADLFTTPIQAVFTRTIADPAFGAKVTGKLGSNALGVMAARDQVNHLLFPGSQGSAGTSIDDEVVTAIARLRRDVGAASTIGVLYTGREAAGYYNRLGGLDALFRPWQSVTVRAQYLHSRTRYPDDVAEVHAQPRDPFVGHGATVNVRYETRNWTAAVDLRARDADFRADAGFVTQVDVLGGEIWFDRRFWGNRDTWYTQLGVAGGAWHTETFRGGLVTEGVWTNFWLDGPLQSSVWANPDFVRQSFGGQTFELLRLWTGGSIEPSGRVRFSYQGMIGDEVDFANVQKAFNIRVAPSLGIRFGRHLDLQLGHTIQRLAKRGREIFVANIAQGRVVYNFSARTFARLIVQFRDTDRNPEAYSVDVQPNRRSVFAQLLLSYKINPQTAVYLGYSDNRLSFTDAQGARVPLTQMNRTLFLKLGYAWRP